MSAAAVRIYDFLVSEGVADSRARNIADVVDAELVENRRKRGAFFRIGSGLGQLGQTARILLLIGIPVVAASLKYLFGF